MSDSVDVQRLAKAFWRIGKVPHDPSTKAFLDRCESHTITVNGKSQEYFQTGTGPTVLLVHGVHSNLGSMVPIAEALLAEHYQVVLFDAPSHGEADGTSTDPVEISGVIRELYGRFADLRAVVGHSLGGLWALAAWHSGVGAKTLIAISTPSTMDFLVDKFVEMNKVDGDHVPELTKQIQVRVGQDAWNDYSPIETAKKTAMSGLIIHGTNDEFVPVDHAGNLHSHWSRSTVELVPDARHFDILRSPKVRELIVTHLRELA